MSARKPSPATKQDLRSLESGLTRQFTSQIDQKLTDTELRLTKHFDEKLAATTAESEARILRHFDLTVEAIRHDLVGANSDEISSLDDRVTRLEEHFGLAR